MQQFLTYSLVSILLFCFGCSKAQPTLDFPKMEFKVNFDMLDSERTVSECKLSFITPRGFQLLPDTIITAIRKGIASKPEGTVPRFTPVSVFVNPQMNASLIMVSTLTRVDNTDFVDYVKHYEPDYHRFYPESKTTVFSVNGIRCWQAKRIVKDQVQFRFLFDTAPVNPFAQVDFSLPVSSSTDVGHLIESTVGTIKLNP